MTRHFELEATPCIPGKCRIPLLRPTFSLVDQRPLRIVKAWVGPGGIVSGMKAPKAAERGRRIAACDQTECLCRGRGCAQHQQNRSKHAASPRQAGVEQRARSSANTSDSFDRCSQKPGKHGERILPLAPRPPDGFTVRSLL